MIPAQAFIATSINIPLFESSKQQQNDDFNYKSHIINFDLSSNPIQKFASDSFVHMPRLHKMFVTVFFQIFLFAIFFFVFF